MASPQPCLPLSHPGVSGEISFGAAKTKVRIGRGGGWECFKQALKRKNHHWEKNPKIEKKLTNLLYNSQVLELKSSHK